MKRLFIIGQCIALALLFLQYSSAAFAQEQMAKDLGEGKQTSPSGLTGAEAGGSTTAAKPGQDRLSVPGRIAGRFCRRSEEPRPFYESGC